MLFLNFPSIASVLIKKIKFVCKLTAKILNMLKMLSFYWAWQSQKLKYSRTHVTCLHGCFKTRPLITKRQELSTRLCLYLQINKLVLIIEIWVFIVHALSFWSVATIFIKNILMWNYVFEVSYAFAPLIMFTQ